MISFLFDAFLAIARRSDSDEHLSALLSGIVLHCYCVATRIFDSGCATEYPCGGVKVKASTRCLPWAHGEGEPGRFAWVETSVNVAVVNGALLGYSGSQKDGGTRD